MLGIFTPHLIVMSVLIVCSAFFSASEAGLFYLSRRDRSVLRTGHAAQRKAVELLDSPERLLAAILFWNLVINIIYFSVASIVSLQLDRQGLRAEAATFALCSLLLMIFLSEMTPKNIAVLRPRWIAAAVSMPIAASVRVVDPILPVLHGANRIAQRLLFPRFQSEPYLEIADLERAIDLSTTDRELLVHEHAVLNNIVSLSETRVEELMRPRTQYLTFQPPVKLADLKGRMTPSGYLLITEPKTEEVAGAIPLRYFPDLPSEHLENYAEAVCYTPWCTTVGEALDLMQRRDREVAAVVNEYGETIGIVTYDDILDTLFSESTSRSQRLHLKTSVVELGGGRATVTGMTSLRRLSRHLGRVLPPTKSVTVGGLLQEQLQRFPSVGDDVTWAELRFRVVGSEQRGPLEIEVTDQTFSGNAQ